MRYVMRPDDEIVEHKDATDDVVDGVGVLRLFSGDSQVGAYQPGEWRSCSAKAPHVMLDADKRDFD